MRLTSIRNAILLLAATGAAAFIPTDSFAAATQGVSGTPPAAQSALNKDGTVTLSVIAPDARSVEAWGEWPKPYGVPLVAKENGLWTATLTLPHGIWDCDFQVFPKAPDNTPAATPLPARQIKMITFELPGGMPWEPRPGVPHGGVKIVPYNSKLLNKAQTLHVYTPPGYESDAINTYPVLYLLHGSGQNDRHWMDIGKANTILDNFIADKKAKPMIIVSPDGNSRQFSQELIEEIIPMIDARYRTQNSPQGRAIAGLSMGGQQSLAIGLHHPELFAWVCPVSSPILNPEKEYPDHLRPKETSAAPASSLLWIACGDDDYRFFKPNQQFDQTLTQWHVKHQFTAIPGKHAWPVWRTALVDFAPLLFQPSPK